MKFLIIFFLVSLPLSGMYRLACTSVASSRLVNRIHTRKHYDYYNAEEKRRHDEQREKESKKHQDFMQQGSQKMQEPQQKKVQCKNRKQQILHLEKEYDQLMKNYNDHIHLAQSYRQSKEHCLTGICETEDCCLKKSYVHAYKAKELEQKAIESLKKRFELIEELDSE